MFKPSFVNPLTLPSLPLEWRKALPERAARKESSSSLFLSVQLTSTFIAISCQSGSVQA